MKPAYLLEKIEFLPHLPFLIPLFYIKKSGAIAEQEKKNKNL